MPNDSRLEAFLSENVPFDKSDATFEEITLNPGDTQKLFCLIALGSLAMQSGGRLEIDMSLVDNLQSFKCYPKDPDTWHQKKIMVIDVLLDEGFQNLS